MTRLLIFALLISAPLTAIAAETAPDPKVPPVQAVQGVSPQPDVFEVSRAKKPLVLRSEKDAGKHFAKDDLAKLLKQVDFTQQIVLVFAWRGSGQDRLTYRVAESYPEQVTFQHHPGRTRDLRPHVKIHALRSNVRWSTGK